MLVDVKPNYVLTDIYESANNPLYIKNKRRTVRVSESSSESDESYSMASDSVDNSSFDSELDEADESINSELISQVKIPNETFDNKSLSVSSQNNGYELQERRNTEFEIDQIKKLIQRMTKSSLTESLLRKSNEDKRRKNTIPKKKDIIETYFPRPKGFLTEMQLRNDEWLSDQEIFAFLNKIKEYLNANNIRFQGLNDPTVLTALRTDNINMRQENFVEVLNSNNNHWVCVAAGLNIGNEDLCLFDSMPRREIDTELGTTCSLITTLPRLEKGHIIFRVQKVSKQRANFCGYFALANAMAICLGLDPETLIYDENQLRNHFISIIYHNQPVTMLSYTLKKKICKKTHKYLRFNLNDVINS